MGWFSRKRDEAAPGAGTAPGPGYDAELTFFRDDEADRFRALVRRVTAEAGWEMTVHPGHVVSDDGRTWGLWNVAANAHNAEHGEAEWPQIVRGHFDTLLAPGHGSTAGLSDEEYLDRLHVRLVEAGPLSQLEGGFDHAVEWAEGVVRLPVVDLPDSIATPPDSDIREHADLATAMDRAWRNTRGLVDTEELSAEQVRRDERWFTCVLGDSFFTASLALFLPELVHRFEPGADLARGVVFSVPYRHQLNYRVVDGPAAALDALLLIPQFTVLGFDDSPGPLSPHTYLWLDGEVTQLTRLTDDQLAVIPGPLEPLLHEGDDHS
jgi:hypothetical protein